MGKALIIFILLAIGYLYWNRHEWQIKRWRKQLLLDKHSRIFSELYSDVNGFALSQKSRQKNDSIEYVYGEIDFESFIAILTLCKTTTDTIFYDLGSGTGKAVLAAAMVFSVQTSCGIELFPLLQQSSTVQQHRLRSYPDYQECAKHIVFIQNNFLKQSISDATLVFINSTTFFGESWTKICRHIEMVQPGCIVVTTSKLLDSSLFIVIRIAPIKMSWGVVSAFIQQRIPNI